MKIDLILNINKDTIKVILVDGREFYLDLKPDQFNKPSYKLLKWDNSNSRLKQFDFKQLPFLITRVKQLRRV